MNHDGMAALAEALDDLQQRTAELQAAFSDDLSPDVVAALLEATDDLLAAVRRHQRLCRVVLLSLLGECGKAEIEKL